MRNKRKSPSKRKTKTAKNRFQPHFRKAYNGKFTGHPQYIYDEDGTKYKIIGITSAKNTNGVLNVELDVNPEPKNTKKAYIRPKPDSENKGAFGERLKGWRFVESDKKKVRNVIDGYKKKK